MTNKILIHSNYSPIKSFGGVELVVKNLLQLTKDLNFETHCFFGCSANNNFYLEGVFYYSRKILFRKLGASILSFGNFSFINKAKCMDLIIFQEPYPTLWPALFFLNFFFRKKIIVLIHANPVAKPLVRYIYGIIRAIIFYKCCVVFTSTFVKEQVISRSFYISRVIPLGIHRNQIGSSKPSFILPKCYALYIGRISSYKGITVLLEAIKISPHINFIIAGSGPLSNLTNSFISLNRLNNVLFLNEFISDEFKEYLISNCLFLVFPSTSQNEAFGLVQLEAMKYSKAIINTNLHTGVNYVAPHGLCAISVQPYNYRELADAINLLFLDKSLRDDLGFKGEIRFKENFTLEHFFYNWNLLINFIMTKSIYDN